MDSEQRQITEEIAVARERVAEDVHSIGAGADIVGSVTHAAAHKVENVRDAAASPLVLLAVGLIAGALVGFMLPVSRPSTGSG
ncbi:MAG TPA: hypothetical protein VIG51_06965 [Candidatus Baltobacteraceae bacterium]